MDTNATKFKQDDAVVEPKTGDRGLFVQYVDNGQALVYWFKYDAELYVPADSIEMENANEPE